MAPKIVMLTQMLRHRHPAAARDRATVDRVRRLHRQWAQRPVDPQTRQLLAELAALVDDPLDADGGRDG